MNMPLEHVTETGTVTVQDCLKSMEAGMELAKSRFQSSQRQLTPKHRQDNYSNIMDAPSNDQRVFYDTIARQRSSENIMSQEMEFICGTLA